jgi:hypothetical protein
VHVRDLCKTGINENDEIHENDTAVNGKRKASLALPG